MTLSLRQLARAVEVTPGFLSQIRTGKRPLPERLKRKIEKIGAAHLLDVENAGKGDLMRSAGPKVGSQSRRAPAALHPA